MLGLPMDSWLLIAFSVGLGLALELAFLRNQMKRRRWQREQIGPGGGPSQ